MYKLAKNIYSKFRKSMQNPIQATNTNSEQPPERLSIGKAAEYLGVSVDTLRRWEKKGRVTPLRSPGGHRYYIREELDNLFGKKYTRDAKPEAKVEEKPAPSPESPQQQTLAQEPQPVSPPPEEPSQPAVLEEPQAKSYVVEEVKTPEIPKVKPETKLNEKDQEKLNNILAVPKTDKMTSVQKVGITAIIVFFVIDIILLLLWFSSRTILSPVP